MTLKYYVKGREDIASATAAVGTVYTAWNLQKICKRSSPLSIAAQRIGGYQVRVKLQKALQNPEISGSEVMLPWQKSA